jgi:FkbH-like protein
MDKNKILKMLGDIAEADFDELLQLPYDTKIADIGIDSIRFIQFIVSLEEEFGIEVLDSDLLISNFQTIGMLFDTLAKYFKKETPIKKVLVCDCDNVLWHGIAGEEDIFLDEDVQKFHRTILELYDRGILLCLCSKSDADCIENAFNSLDSKLKPEHFVISKINFDDKVTNLKRIADDLGLYLDSFVFVDDSDYELGLVRSVLPEVTVFKADYTDMAFVSDLKEMFEYSPVSDFDRTKQYRDQKEREKEKQHYHTVEEYNASLETIIVCDVATEEQARRISELSERTNRFNLSGVRYNEDDVKRFISDRDHTVYYINASDKYGDMGLVGAAVVDNMNTVILGFFLSCRVFGRGFENTLIEKIKNDFDGLIYGIYNKNDKNRQFERFYAENGVIMHE